MQHSAEDSKEAVVEEIHCLNGIVVLQIAAGAEHSALVTGNNLFFLSFLFFTWLVDFLCEPLLFCREWIDNDVGLG